jgi:hypothetical protein
VRLRLKRQLTAVPPAGLSEQPQATPPAAGRAWKVQWAPEAELCHLSEGRKWNLEILQLLR